MTKVSGWDDRNGKGRDSRLRIPGYLPNQKKEKDSKALPDKGGGRHRKKD